MTAHTQSPDFAALDDLIVRLNDMTMQLIADGRAADIPDEAITGPLYTAAKLFAAKKDVVRDLEWPIATDALTATETVVLVAALLDAADVNIFDMAIWYRRV